MLAATAAYSSDLSRDDSGTWRINTLQTDQRNTPHMMLGKVYKPGDGLVYINIYGPIDNMECSMHLPEFKEAADTKTKLLLDGVFKALGKDDYAVSMSVSVCQPEWFVLYLHDGKDFASKSVYDKIMKPLNLK